MIAGAGFAGLWAARDLAFRPVKTLLLDRNNFHMFLPLLYQVAAAELESEDVAYPVRSILQAFPSVEFTMSEITGIDPDAKTVRTAEGRISYDFLVIATGSVSHFFGVPGAAEYSFPLKALDEAVALRSHILQMFERASREPDPEMRRSALTFVIVGGGATGVEYSGALMELIRGPLRKDFSSLDFEEVKVVVIEARDGLLPGMPGVLRDYARRRLIRKGVEVRLGTTVSRVTEKGVRLGNGSFLSSETVVWTAGIRGEPPGNGWGAPVSKDGRVRVASTLQIPGHPEIYAVGDVAYLEQEGKPLPMMAPVAIQMGKAAAENIARQIAGLDPLPFRYRDSGSMVILGRNAAVAQLRGRGYTGFFAWILWLAVHIFQLIGFRNRLVVMINWAWDYFFFERAVRIILPSPRPATRNRSEEGHIREQGLKSHGGGG